MKISRNFSSPIDPKGPAETSSPQRLNQLRLQMKILPIVICTLSVPERSTRQETLNVHSEAQS